MEIYSRVWMRSSGVCMRSTRVWTVDVICRVWMRSSQVWMRSSWVWIRSSRVWMRSSRVWWDLGSSRVWMRSYLVVRSLVANAKVATPIPIQWNLRGGKWRVWMWYSRMWMRSSLAWMRSSQVWMWSYLVVRALVANAKVATPIPIQWNMRGGRWRVVD